LGILAEKAGGSVMTDNHKPMVNPYVLLREEFDDWAILFDPDTGRGFGLNPTGVYVWKLLDGKHSMDDMLKALHRNAKDVPQEASEHLVAFIEELVEHGLAAHEREQAHSDVEHQPCASEKLPDESREGGLLSDKMLCYEQPRLVSFGLEQRALGASCGPGSVQTTGDCHAGNLAGCGSGQSVHTACRTGTAAGYPLTCSAGTSGNLNTSCGSGTGVDNNQACASGTSG
jgi:SynChlorMet cassette protein ScmD